MRRTGGPAFARAAAFSPRHGEDFDSGDEGMSLRDYFAAKAMHAECVTAGQDDGAAIALAEAANKACQTIEQRIAFNAYRIADAMLAEREK